MLTASTPGLPAGGSAFTVGTEYLITLDKGLEEAIARAGAAIVARSPGEFFRSVLTQHPD